MKIKLLALMMATSLVASCATNESTTPIKTKEELLQELKAMLGSTTVAEETKGSLSVVARFPLDYSGEKAVPSADTLHLVRQAHSSKVVALKTAKVALGIFGALSGFGGGVDYQGSDKRDLKGDVLDVGNPSLQAAFPLVRDYVFREFKDDGKGQYFPVVISSERFSLVYEKYGQDNDGRYFLHQNITFKKTYEDNRKDPFKFVCLRETAVHTLPEWQANNYRLVQEESVKYAQSCVKELLEKHKANFHASFVR